MNKRILVIGTNAGQADLIRYLTNNDWYVVACSQAENEPGSRLCDVFEKIDVKDLDALESVIRKHRVELVYTVSSDIGMRTVVELSTRLNLPSYFDLSLINLLEDKTELRSVLKARGVDSTCYASLSNTIDADVWTAFPCVVKPADSQGQRGVAKVDSLRNLVSAVNLAIETSPTARAIVEPLLQGPELSSNVLVSKGKIRFSALSERLVHAGPMFGLPRGHLIPAQSINKSEAHQCQNLVEEAIRVLEIEDGLLHFQMIVASDGPHIIEIAPRLDGCHLWRLTEAAYGVNLLELAINRLCGRDIAKVELSRLSSERLELIFQQALPNSVFDPADYPIPEDHLYHEFRYTKGETVRPINGLFEVVGYYIRPTS